MVATRLRFQPAWTGTMWHWIGAAASLLEAHPSYRAEGLAEAEATGTCSGWIHRWLQCQRCSLFGSSCFATQNCCSCTGWARSAERKIRWRRLHHRIQRNSLLLLQNCGCNYYFWIDYCNELSLVSRAWEAGWLPQGGWAADQLVFSSRCSRDRRSSPLHTGTFLSLSSTCMEWFCSSSALRPELSCRSSWEEAATNKILALVTNNLLGATSNSLLFVKHIKSTYIVWLSEIFWSVGKLTVLSEWTFVVVQVVLAQLSFVFLLQSIELALVSVEVVVVGLLSKVPHHFSRWVVEVPWSALSIHTFALVTRSLDWWWRLTGRWCRLSLRVWAHLLGIVSRGLVKINGLDLLGSLGVGWSLLSIVPGLSLGINRWLLDSLLGLFVLLLRCVAHHLSNPLFNYLLISIYWIHSNNIFNLQG